MAVKTVSKAVKYRTVKAGNITLDEAIKLMSANISASMAEMSRKMAESRAETDAKMAESQAKFDAKIAASRAETDAKMAESQAKFDAKIAASDAKIDLAIERMTQRLAESSERMDRRINSLSLNLGNVGNELGEITEFITLPGIRREMKERNHDFTRSLANKKISGIVRGVKQRVAEVDLFLFSGKEAMAVEAKTSLSVEDVNRHLDRLKILRKYERNADVAGKTLYGAVIGIFIDDHARKFALKNGLYVLEVLEWEKKIKTEAPPRPREW